MPISREDISVTSAAGEFAAYCAVPENGKGVAVLVLQEIFGLNANIRSIVDGFAEAGYPAIAPDLFWRQAPGIQLDPATDQGRAQAAELMKGLDRNQAVADGTAALSALRSRVPGLSHSAAVGYCFGGGVAYLMAVRGETDAGVAYYGTGLHTMLDEAKSLRGKLLLHIAADDYICPPEAQQAISAAMAPLGEKAKVIIYPGVGHAFARVGGAAFDEAAAAAANNATIDLLESLAATA